MASTNIYHRLTISELTVGLSLKLFIMSDLIGCILLKYYLFKFPHSVLLEQTVDNINESKYMIDKESLLPGYHYQAKVRARGPVGLWSDWSPLVSWTTHNGVIFIYLFLLIT